MDTNPDSIRNILLVEDDSRDVELTLAALDEYHLANKVAVVRDGEKALDYLYCRAEFKTRVAGNPILVLLDLKMPKVNGLEVLKIMKADEKLKIIPVVVLSSSRETTDMVECYRHGVNAYVVKPVDFTDFMQAVKQLGIFWAAVNELPPTLAKEEPAVPITPGTSTAAKPLLHILHLEDNPNDAALIQATLEGGGISCATTRVQSHDDFVAALERGSIDLILSDFSLPSFNGLAAAEIAHTRWPAIPFIFVSGTLGEERAIDSLKSGATDYVLKRTLSRLVPAVHRAMREVEIRLEHKRLEADFVESQKMEVLGQLAGGAAHDFNNILSVIMGYSDLLAGELGLDSPLRRYTEHILQASHRAVGLTRQLLVFSRKQTVQPVVLDLNNVVRDLDQMLRRLIDENIEMTIDIATQVGNIRADSGYLGQVLMNLAVNARDAMPNGGKLNIRTRNSVIDENSAQTHPGATPGNYVVLSVSDTGTGMTDQVKAHLFEAFFTTKPKGKGTGLGLATCRTIVNQMGGYIYAQSEVGHGTTFTIYFPQVELPLDVAAGSTRSAQLPRGSETVLVVEDEPSVRQLARGILEAQGYGVLSALNGEDALHVARKHKGSPIRLVVTDVIMPLMGGKVMVASLKSTYPDLKILFTSGYPDDSIARHCVLEAGVEFLPKPYTARTLAHRVRELLDTPQVQS